MSALRDLIHKTQEYEPMKLIESRPSLPKDQGTFYPEFRLSKNPLKRIDLGNLFLSQAIRPFDKAHQRCRCRDCSRHWRIVNAFNIPLLFLQDVPGFMVGSKVEQQGIIRHGAKMLYAVSRASVPKLTVVIRKAYGAGYYVMCGRGYEPDGIVAWPSAEISLMGAEGAVSTNVAGIAWNHHWVVV